MKNHYLFIVSDQVNKDGKKVTGKAVFDSLMSKKAWGFHPTTQHRAVVKDGDEVIFYLTGAGFIGKATLKSPAYIDKTGDSETWWFNRSDVNYRVDLKDIDVWQKTKPIQPILPNLSFVKKTKNWGVYLQGGVRKISEEDYLAILNSSIYEVESIQEKSVSETILSFNPESASYNPHLLQSPERIKISRIVENVQKGWQIPNFQRYFDWNKEYIRSFLESVFNDYYVGSFLIWEASDHSNLEVQPIKGVDTKNQVDKIILDGQQRMTALYYAMKTPDFSPRGSKKRSYYYLDIRAFIEDASQENIIVIKDKKISRDDSFKQLMFPFYELEKLHEWIDNFEDYLEKEVSDKTQVKSIGRTIEKRLRHMWDGFEIPYVVLPATMDLVHVADIFEKINSKGKPLSTFDLLIARLLKYKIKLKDLWDKACEEYPNLKKYDEETEKIRMAVFQTMSLLYHPTSSCKRKDILNIYEALSIADQSQFESYWNTCVEALNDSIERLENMRDGGFGVRSAKDIPFMPALPMLAAFLVRIEESGNEALSQTKMHQWYWSATITRAYSSSAESQMTSDFKEVTRWFDDENSIPSVVVNARNQIEITNLFESDEQSSADYRAILSLSALAGAKDFVTGSNLEHARDNQKDHIFPKSVFTKNKYIDSVLNMTWMSDTTNMFIKKAKKPSEYILTFIKENFRGDENKFIECLESHLIDKKAFEAMKNDDLDLFLTARQEKIKKELRQRVGGVSILETKMEDDPNGLIDDTEEKIRLLINKTLSAKNNNYWETLIPQGIREKVKEKIEQHIQKHPNESSTKRDGLNKLSFCDVMDYYEIIVSRTNWSNFESRFVKKSELEKHFVNLKEYRNCIKHSRVMNNVTRKQGEASLEWIYSLLKN